jgi:hypothetical protein
MSAGKQRSGELWVLMQARRLGFGRNPLRRRSDRIEGILLWCALAAALLVIPLGAAAGTSIGNTLEASAARQRAALHEVRAQTLEGTDGQVPSAPGSVLARVPVRYVDQLGAEHVGLTNVVIGTMAGEQVTVWLDRSGNIAAAPRSKSDSTAFGATLGFLTILGSWLLLWGLFRLARIPLDRRRARDCEAEWRSVAPRWLRGQK